MEAVTPADLVVRHKGFTPGPWKLVKKLSASENDKGWDLFSGCSLGYWIGEVSPVIDNDRGDASATGEANAALIADAPALLALAERQARRIAVLEGALRRLFNLQPTQESSCNPTYWAAVQEARAALKEAEGE